MTQIAAPADPSAPLSTTSNPLSPAAQAAASRDLQRESLDQIVRLSNECTAEEQRIDEEHSLSLTRENADYHKKVAAAKERVARKKSELAKSAAERLEIIESRHAADGQSADSTLQQSLAQFARKKEENDGTLKKNVEQAAWQAESVLVTLQMKVDEEEKKFNKELEASLAEIASLNSLEEAAHRAITRYKLPVPGAPEPVFDDATRERVAREPKAVHAEERAQAEAHLKEIQRLTQTSMMDDVIPFFLVLGFGAIAAGIGWISSPDNQQTKMYAAGGAAGGAIVLAIIGWVFLRYKKRKRIQAKSTAVYAAFKQSLATAIFAATLDPEAAAAAREKKVTEGRQKRDHDISAVKEKAKALLVQAAEKYKTAVAEANQNHQSQHAAADAEKEKSLADLEQNRAKLFQHIEDDDTATRTDNDTRHTQTLAAIENKYTTETRALTDRWETGLRTVTEALSVGVGIDPRLIDWNSPAWNEWKAPSLAEASGQIHFGDMKVDLAQLTQQLPKRLKLPETFAVPAMLALPAHGSLLVETDHAGRAAAVDVAQMIMARLLTQLPAGRVKFTVFDPVGLGQSFAGFMHLADHDESLIGLRIWTEKEHINQRLADLTEHMETVIQKYLRNEYASIDQYNAQAGELAEPIRYLVIADFPTGFEQESLRRLASIATSGPRCGVYTLILRDTRQALPPGARMEEIIKNSVRLQYKNGAFTWDDAVFKKFPLAVDPAPNEKVVTHLMDVVGKAAKVAKRVEVPFQSIAPKDDQFWSQSSKNDIRVPIGKSGATRLQPLRLGVGVAQHVLVAGKTGSGKSNLMHTIVTNMAMWYGPDEVEFYLVDFKKGVEFKAYATSQLPHARAIAVESDREFGLSVLQRVDAELSRRGNMFRDVGAQEIGAFRDKTGQKLPRTILLIDEFQEFFSEDDKLSQEAAGLLDRLVRQGRAFGVHVVLGSQTIGGASGLARSTLGQIAVRVALQCTEADSQLILGDNNGAARLLTRPGEAVYNDAGGLVENNSPFQIAFLPDQQRENFLDRVRTLAHSKGVTPPKPIVFEGNSAAAIRGNPRLMALLERPDFPAPVSSIPAYVGEPVAIKEPSSIPFRRQIGANLLMVGQQEEAAIAMFGSIIVSLAAQHAPADAIFYLMDGSANDSKYSGLLDKVLASVPQKVRLVPWREVPDAINELAQMQKQRQSDDAHSGPAVYLLMFGLQRYRLLRKQEDDFSFSSKSDEPAAPKPDKQFAELLSDGPALGLHTIIWSDTPITLERTLERAAMRQFDWRILFQMSAADSSNLIDSPLANRLGTHRALLYSEEQGTFEKCRPYEVPDEAWLKHVADHLKNRKV